MAVVQKQAFRAEEVFMATVQGIKEEARRLIDKLSDDATWEDLMYEVYVRQAIEAGLQDSQAGRVIAVGELRAKFGLSK